MTRVKRPSRRDVNKILGFKVYGWNDKRSYGNRIKLDELLNESEMELLKTELPKMFPDFKFSVEVFKWRGWGRYKFVTTIKYSAI